MKKIVSAVLCLAICVSISSGSVLAANGSEPALQTSDYTTSDLVQLMKYMVGLESIFGASTADINGDGAADILDVVHLDTPIVDASNVAEYAPQAEF